MHFELSRKLVFRQGEYESVTVEAKAILDTEQDDVTESEAANIMNDRLDELVYPTVVDAAGTTRDEDSFSHFYQKEIEHRHQERNQ